MEINEVPILQVRSFSLYNIYKKKQRLGIKIKREIKRPGIGEESAARECRRLLRSGRESPI